MIEAIAPAEFAAWAARQDYAQPPLLIDVREPWEWALAHLPAQPGCELLHLPLGNLPSELARLDPDRPTALMCHHGMRSLNAAMFLQANGFERLGNLVGGIDAWAQFDAQVPRY
ncbi:rhodanese-like domain-containing protein [Vandammella animalimorsus]|uniref:rhodanese-like domain-containing protein n=1 Tax=Vandammella animalimorsus TaxID=2029117 RepID=UPI0031BA0E5C